MISYCENCSRETGRLTVRQISVIGIHGYCAVCGFKINIKPNIKTMSENNKAISSIACAGSDARNQAHPDIHAAVNPSGSIEFTQGNSVVLTIPQNKRAELAEFIANAQ